MALVAVLSIPIIPVNAAETRASSYFRSCFITVYDGGSDDIEIEVSVTATGKMDTLGATKVVLQKKSGDSWITIKAYTTDNADLQDTDCAFFSILLSYSGAVSGATYRAVAAFYAEDDSGSETRTFPSDPYTA